MAENGKLTVYYGCMFAGKTTALISHLSALKLRPSEFLVLKPSADTRSGKASITTHNGRAHDCLIYEPEMDINEHITPYTRLIAIDEAQFFDKLFLSELRRLILKGIDVVAAGLDKDYLGRPFGLMPLLIDLADHRNQLMARCAACGKDAEYTYRKVNNKVLILIGQEEHYEPRCGDCMQVVS